MTAWCTPAGQLPLDVAAREQAARTLSIDLTLAIDPDLTPVQQSHRAAREIIARTEHELAPRSNLHAMIAVRRALHTYHKAASRPRTGNCWAFVVSELWNARANALKTGAIVRHSQDHVFISDRYNDAQNKLSTARQMERNGRADARV
jgi:hypothetical protein